jgi:DinB superfamily
MNTNSKNLLNDLSATTIGIINTIATQIPHERLFQKPAPEKWSAAECLEHLNLYGDFYLPAMQQAIETSLAKGLTAKEKYASSWLGDYFVRTMQPKNGQVTRTMKTFKDKNPTHLATPPEVLQRFMKQQSDLLAIIKSAQHTDLQRIKIPLTIPYLKLRLGDVLRFVVAHNERHVLQALNAVR